MKIGIFGQQSDAHCHALMQSLQARSAQVVFLDSDSLNRGVSASFLDGHFSIQDQHLSDVRSWFVRKLISPLPPAFEMNDEYYLFADWYKEYMHQRERFSFQLSAMMTLEFRGIPVVNPAEHTISAQLHIFHLAAASDVGLQIPRTLVTNDTSQVLKFLSQVRNVVYRPSAGGSSSRLLDEDALARLDHLVFSPVIFREWVRGVPIRAIVIGDQVVVCVKISTPSQDYRNLPNYVRGQPVYVPTRLDTETERKCLRLAQACGLLVAGIELVMQEDGSYVFLEANPVPDYLDIEQKTRVPITDSLANYLLLLANDPDRYRQGRAQAKRAQSFVKYSSPFHPERDLE